MLPVPPPASMRIFASYILPIVMPRLAHFLKCPSDERNLFGDQPFSQPQKLHQIECSLVGLASMRRSRCLASSFSRTARWAAGSYIVP